MSGMSPLEGYSPITDIPLTPTSGHLASSSSSRLQATVSGNAINIRADNLIFHAEPG
jgi:hypothetical protein